MADDRYPLPRCTRPMLFTESGTEPPDDVVRFWKSGARASASLDIGIDELGWKGEPWPQERSLTVGQHGGTYSITAIPWRWWERPRWLFGLLHDAWWWLRGYDIIPPKPSEGAIAKAMVLPLVEEFGRLLAASSKLPAFWTTGDTSPEEWAAGRELYLRRRAYARAMERGEGE